jgi:AhpD family alkylhydroperoxidase
MTRDDLAALLSRQHLAPEERVLVLLKASIWPGDWERFEACVQAARDLGSARARLEEVVLQAILFFGFPRAVTAFEVLQRAWPTATPPSGGALPPSEWPTAGERLFDAIYGKNRDAVRGMLRRHHGELHDFVLESAYGRILSRPGLPPRLRELLAVAALAAQKQTPQLIAHARGALTLGATPVELWETLASVLPDEAAIRDHMERIVAGGPGPTA